jgi:ornithine carbamoyltransferase
MRRARSIDSGKLQVTLTNEITLNNATAIYTDVWASMGQEDERAARRAAFGNYQVNQAVMDEAPGAVFMHCLPAHRGEEVTDEVMDGPRSVVFQQAGNRLYAQMALMARLFGE